MDTKDLIQSCAAICALVIGAVTVGIGLYTFRLNARTKAAEFLLSLHRAFFVEKTYLAVREVIDNASEEAQRKIARYCDKEPAEFVNFLNFFELMASLQAQRVLTSKQVEGLLGYYLDVLAANAGLRAYIQSRHFEYLHRYLNRRQRIAKRGGHA